MLVPPEESLRAFQRAGGVKRLEVPPGVGHFNWQCPDAPLFRNVNGLARDWPREHLPG